MSPKGFAVLTATTAISLGLAGWAVASRDVPARAVGQPEPMFAGLLDKLNDVQTVKITGGAEKVTLKRADGGKWQLEERGGYPADGKRVREVALGLANLKLVGGKSALAARLPPLDPPHPKAGRAQAPPRRPPAPPRPRRPGQARREGARDRAPGQGRQATRRGGG